jgi:RNA polymerase sigma factor (sigma-70 family)
MTRNELILSNLNLVRFVADRMRVYNVVCGGDDLESAGMLGLIQAAERFDPSLGFEFSTFAAPRIRGAMLDELRSKDWLSRSARKRGETSPDFTSINVERGDLGHPWDIADRRAVDPAGQAEAEDEITVQMQRVRRAMKCLPKPKRRAVEKWYLEGVQQKVIAKQHGVSPSRISQAIQEGIASLRRLCG